MSNEKTQTSSGPVIATAAPAEAPETEQKVGFVTRSKRFLKDHKRPAIAVGALVGLVGIAAVAGRKTAPTPDFETTLELESPQQDEEVVVTVDTETA